MEVNEDLTLEVSPASITARRQSLHASRSSGSISISGLPNLSLLTQQLQQGVRLGAEEYASLLRSKWYKHEDGTVPGYCGLWHFYKPASAKEGDETKQFKCIRTYAATPVSDDSDVPEINICNVHDGSASFGQPEQRPQDGLWQNRFQRLLSDPYFSCSMMQLDTLEAAEGLPAACFRRSVPITGANLDTAARVPPALPPGPQQHGAVATGMWGAHAASGAKSPVAWGFEVLIEDGDSRWSMGPLYDMQTLAFQSHFFVQERACDVDLDGPINMDKLPVHETRPRLDPDPRQWLDGRWEGSLVDIVWDEDGEMVRLPPRPAAWSPPDPQRTSHKLFLLPDMMYGWYTVPTLPAVESETMSNPQNHIRFEVGGMMRSKQLFRRVILRYSINGQMESISEEVWRPED